MEQLSGLDAAFLALDSQHTTGHVGGIQIVEAIGTDGRVLTRDRLLDLVSERIHLVPPMRRRIVEVPLGLGRPYWLEDADVDLESHIHELALPAPGTLRELGDQVAVIHALPLDRSRPLWELHLIHGLEGGRSALYAKLHHAMIDGLAGQEISAALLDESPDGRAVGPPPPRTPGATPGSVELLGRAAASLADRPARLARFTANVLRSSPGLLTLVAARLPGGRTGVDVVSEDGPPVRTPRRAPATPFNRGVSAHRRVALRTVPLAVVQAVRGATGTTVNDVLLAACAGALRRWLREHDTLPGEPLVVAVPVSVRTPASRGVKRGDGTFGTQVSVMLATLPTDLEHPLDRIRAVRKGMLAAKDHHRALAANLLADAFHLALPPLFGLTVWANARLRLLERAGLFNLVVSNVPGPSVQLYLAGHRVLAGYPVSAVVDGQGLNITMLSYLDGLHVGLIADRDLVPDADALADYLVEEVGRLAQGASVQWAPGTSPPG